MANPCDFGVGPTLITLEDQWGHVRKEMSQDAQSGYLSARWKSIRNEVGECEIELAPDCPLSWFEPSHGRIKIRTSVNNRTQLENDTWFIILRSELSKDDAGLWRWRVTGYDLKALLRWRVIANFASDTSTSGTGGGVVVPQSDKTLPADDMIKEIAREQMASLAQDYGGANALRAWLGFSVEQSVSQCPTLTRHFAHNNVLDTFKDLADESTRRGTRLYFDVVDLRDDGNAMLITRAPIRGIDRRETALLNELRGNLARNSFTSDHSGEWTSVYALGEGQNTQRAWSNVNDDRISAYGPFGRMEIARDVRSGSAGGNTLNEARSALGEGLPRIALNADLIDTDATCYLRDYRCGDYLKIGLYESLDCDGAPSGNSITLDAYLDMVESVIDRKGKRTNSAQFGVDGWIGYTQSALTDTSEIGQIQSAFARVGKLLRRSEAIERGG